MRNELLFDSSNLNKKQQIRVLEIISKIPRDFGFSVLDSEFSEREIWPAFRVYSETGKIKNLIDLIPLTSYDYYFVNGAISFRNLDCGYFFWTGICKETSNLYPDLENNDLSRLQVCISQGRRILNYGFSLQIPFSNIKSKDKKKNDTTNFSFNKA